MKLTLKNGTVLTVVPSEEGIAALKDTFTIETFLKKVTVGEDWEGHYGLDPAGFYPQAL